jgi:hypothetical protein
VARRREKEADLLQLTKDFYRIKFAKSKQSPAPGVGTTPPARPAALSAQAKPRLAARLGRLAAPVLASVQNPRPAPRVQQAAPAVGVFGHGSHLGSEFGDDEEAVWQSAEEVPTEELCAVVAQPTDVAELQATVQVSNPRRCTASASETCSCCKHQAIHRQAGSRLGLAGSKQGGSGYAAMSNSLLRKVPPIAVLRYVCCGRA